MKKTILILFALFAFTAMADSVFTTMPDTIITSINDHTDSIVMAASDSVTSVVQDVGSKQGLGWKIIAGVLIGVELFLRVIPTKNGATLLGLVSWLHKLIPNNIKKEKKD